MKKIILLISFIAICTTSFAQVVTPFTVRKSVTQKGGILYLSNTSSKAVPDNAVQNEIPPSGTGYDNNFTNGYVDIDGDSSTFMSSSDQLNLTNSCSEISWAGLYWGAIVSPTNTNYAIRNQVKLKINSGSYVNLSADYLKDNSAGYKSYHCFKDITSYIQTNGITDRLTVANVVTETGAKNLFGGWTIVIVYKDNTKSLRNLTVFDGLANVSSGFSTVDIPISGFQTPISGPVNFELGLVVYDGDRSLTGDQLMFKGASAFVNLSDGIHPSTDMFNSTISNNGVLTPNRNPSYNNTLGYDANIFVPNNSSKNYIGNNAISATIRQTTGGETFLTQVVTSAIDVYEPDLRSSVTAENITHPGAALATPGDTIEYTVTGLNIGSDPSVNSYITDVIDGASTYVPNSIKIISGPNAADKTDAAGDDQAEYISATKTVRVRIGTGANSFIGGTVNNSPTGTDSTVFKYRVQITTDCTYLYCHNIMLNSAHIIGTGNLSGNTFDVQSNTKIFDDGSGCAVSGSTPTPVNISGCTAPGVTVNSPICSGGSINLTATYSAGATYLWTGPNGFTSTSASPTISNATAANSGTYTATISVTGTSCHFVYPIVVNVNVADAGPDQTGVSTCGLTTVTLAGNSPTGSTGQWTIISGTGGNFGTGHTSTSSANNATFNGVAGSTYVLRWSLSTPGCSDTTDDVSVTFQISPTLAVLSGTAVTCNNKLNVVITGGVSPYTLNINNGVGTVNNYVSGTDISVNPASTTTYTLSSVLGANGCPAVSISPSVYQLVVTNSMGTGTITQNNLPVITRTNTSATAPTTSASSSTQTDVWSNTANAYASDNTYATVTKTSTGTPSYIYLKGFGFSIPTGATIDGVVVNIEKKSSGGTVVDSRISLLNNTTSLGTNKTISGTWPTTDAVSTYGTSTDLWGATLTPATVNSVNFGIRYRPSFSTANAIAYIDAATIVVYYHSGSTSYCDNATGVSFTVSGYSNATSYTWTPPTGAIITSGQGTSTATFDFDGAGESGNYQLAVTPSNSCGAGSPTSITLPISDCANATPYCVKGNVYWDINSSTSTTGKVDGTGIGTVNGSQLYVTIAKTSGTTTSFATTPVNSDGSWSICNATIASNTAYRVTLSKNNYANATAASSILATLPTGSSNNGEINNDVANSLAGNDATVDGKISFTTATSMTNNETNLNFGLKINTAPVANNDVATTNEDTPVTFSLTNNDTDVDGTVTASTVTLSTASSNGTWSVNATGNVTYTPASNFNGTASITYTVKDNDVLTSNSGTITVTVNAVNDAPVATASSVTGTENATYTFVASDFHYTDTESNTKTGIVLVTLPAKGTLTLNGDAVIVGQTISNSDISNLIYTPANDAYGTPYTTFTFKVNDADLGTVAGTMTINIDHVFGPPIAVNDRATTNQNSAVSFTILTNDTNVDGTITNTSIDLDPLTDGQQSTITVPGQGTFANNGTGTITFTPVSDFYGTTTEITYTVNNSYSLTSNAATIVVTVIPSGAPVAVNDTTTTSQNTAVSFNATTNDTATSGRTINVSRIDLDPTTPGIQQSYYVDGKGQFIADIDGLVTFSPDWNFNGTATVTYTVKDSSNFVSNVATITVTISWANTAPFAIDDFVTTNEDTATTINVTTNDYDLDTTHGNSGVINVASVDLDPNTVGRQTTFTVDGQGTFTVNSSGVVTFTPVANFNGVVTPLEYTVNDTNSSAATSNSGYLYVTVTSVNDAPVATDDTNTTMIATSTTFSITSNDTDVDGTVDVTSVDLDPYKVGQQLTYTVQGEGVYTADAAGNVTFTYTSATALATLTPIYYTVNDNNGLVSNLGRISITLNPGAPTATDDTITTNEDIPVSFDVTANDTDVNGVAPGINKTTVALVGTATSASGTWSITDSINFPGQITFTPAADYFGTSSIQYTVRDLDGNISNTATVTATILSVNDVPSFTVGSNQIACYNSSAQSVNNWATAISAGPSNESSQTVSFVVVNSNNSLFSVQPAISASGTLTYTPATNQSGSATVTVYIQDDGGITNDGIDTSLTQTFTILINPLSFSGTISTSGSQTICAGSTKNLTLTGSTGTIQWQSSTDNSSFGNIAGATSATYSTGSLSTTTYFRAVATSGTCTSTSSSFTITVNPTSVSGSITGATTVCTGTNSTVLTLGGNTGTIQWQSSSSLAGTYANISGATSSTYTVTNISAATYYRAVVTSGLCSSATSSSVTMSVSTPSVSGSITGATTVCTGTNSTVLTLGGSTGSIQWQSSPNNSTFGDISGATSATYTATNLTATTYYRAIVTNGGCSSATTSSVTMTVSPASVAGSITGATTVCTGTNSTVLTLGSNTGNVSKWQYSSDNFASDVHDVANITTSLTATNLTATTYYRAVVTSGVCSSATTTAVTISVSPASVGGSVSGSATVCSGTNSTTLTLGSNTGNVTKWQSSATSDFASSTDIANTTTSLTATNLTATTYYRAVVTSGACSAANSANAIVTVSPTSVGGSISGDATVCSGTNSTDLSLSGYTGSVTKWQSSTVSDFSSAVTDIANITATLTATNLTATTYYRAVVASGSCTSANSAVATITYAPSVGGFVSGSTSVCSGTNSATLTVSSYIGSITKWQSSTVSDFSSAVSDIANTSSSLAVSNISATTYYRAVVQSGSCSADYSDIGTITVTTPSVGGTVSGSTTLLTGVNTATLSLTGNTGDVIKWQSSSVSDFSSNVSDIANITSSLTVNNLNATTYYRAVVESGNCPTANSAIATVTVTASGGGTTSGGATLCSATNSTTLTLSGYIGTIVKWQSSTVIDFTSGVVDIANTTTSLTVTNLTATKYYRAIVAAIGSATQYSSSVSTITYSNVPLIIGEVYGPTDLCGLTSATFGVPVVSGATKYIWTFPAGLSVHSSGGNEVVVNIDPLYISGTITVRAINDCAGINSGTKTISPYKIPVIATITGPTSTCGITTATYIATVLPDATYAWTVPTGMTITSGDATNTITVAIDSNFTNGNLSCVATNSCGVSNRKILGISSVDGPSNISGPQNACGLTTATYATATVSGASSYSWTVPSGMTITSGQGTISIVVAIQNTFSGGDVAVALNYGCGSSNLRKLPVGVAQTPDAISGPKALCGLGEITYDTAGNILDTAGGIAYYSVAAVYGAISYIWTVPTGATIISGQGTTRVGVSFDYTTFSSGTISVQSQSTCGTSAKSNVIVKRLGGNIIGLTELCNVSTARYYLPFTTGSSFKWTVPSWMTITSGQNTSDITVSITGSPCSDTVKIDFVSNCGTTENFVLTVGCSQTSKLVASICGSTIYSESSPIYANAVTGATQYKFKVYDGVQTQYIEQNTPAFTLSNFTGWSYGTTYTVSVAPKVNGSYLAYGCSCSVSLSSPKTQLVSSVCGATLTSLYAPLYANAITGGTSYKFEVTNGSTVRTYTSTTNSFNLMQLILGAIPSTTYSVRVDVLYNGSWLGYGNSCNVTTPLVGTTQLVSSVCGATLTSLYSPLYANAVPLATGYQFEVSLGATLVGTYNSTSNVFNLMQLSGILYGTTYSIRVAPYYNNAYQTYGGSCTVTTPSIGMTQLVSSACGATLNSIYAPLYANAITSATGYRFEVSNGGVTKTYDASSNVFNLMQIDGGVFYNTVYAIRVAPVYNGQLQSFGNSCNVTTPVIGTTQLVSSVCGATLTSLYAPLYANAITSATGYRFEVNNGGVTKIFDSATNVFNLMQIDGGVLYGTTYSIRVAIVYNGVVQAFGTSCNITTPAIPTTMVVASRCGTVLTSLSAPIYANVVSLATGYKFEVRNASTGVLLGTTSDASITNVFSLKQIPGTGVNTAYSIRVALQYNGTWQDYGPSCVVTTAVNAITTRMNDTEIATSVFSVKAFPNPFATSFNLAIESSSDDQVEVAVYDMIGRLLEANKATVSELSTQEIGNNYPSGVYNIIVSQGDQTKTIRMIKR